MSIPAVRGCVCTCCVLQMWPPPLPAFNAFCRRGQGGAVASEQAGASSSWAGGRGAWCCGAGRLAEAQGLTPGCCGLQADSPEDMHSWIRAIAGAVQALKTRPRVGHICVLCQIMIMLTHKMLASGLCKCSVSPFPGEVPALLSLPLLAGPLERIEKGDSASRLALAEPCSALGAF